MKDKEEALQEQIADLKQKMKDDKSGKDKAKDGSKKDPGTPFDFKRVFKASVPFIIILVFIIGFFAGTTFQKSSDNKRNDQSGGNTNAAPVLPGDKVVNDIKNVINLDECSDTDNGFNQFETGTVFFNSGVYFDACQGNASVLEYACAENMSLVSKTMPCDYCENGRCVAFQPKNNGCKESDNGVDYKTKGYVVGKDNKMHTDSCSLNSLEEWYCDTYGNPATKYSLCDKCEDGACVPAAPQPSGCKDTDSGRDFYVKGTVTDAAGRTGTDNCQSRTLEEYYCDSRGYLYKTYFLCNQCVDGACIKTPES